MKLTTLSELLVNQLKDLHSAEQQLVKALPKIAKHVSSPALKQAIEHHLEETRGHVERLEKAATILNCKVTGHKCKAMQGLVEEGDEALKAAGEDSVIDAAIVAAAQRVEHYEIAAYGAARTMANLLGRQDVTELLEATLKEEKAADEKLTEVVEADIYPSIADHGHNSEDGNNEELVGQREGSSAR